ncbi:MAG TPA: hypothetical protein VMU15_11005 [Anaeromyxobacter sp.]|nr:hypothetical protein [Anaeromyxobacter sp.]
MTGRGILAAAALLTAGAGCGSINALKTKAPDPGTREGDWAAVRNAATRRAVLYDRFVHRATVTATYLGPAERRARVARLAHWLDWTEEERATRQKAEDAEAARYDDFLVALYTADHRDNDLDSQRSIWRVALDLPGGKGKDLVTRDAKVQDVDATLRNLFPFLGPFEIVYRVRFPRMSGPPLSGGAFTLELSSALGKLELPFGNGAVGPDRPEGAWTE